MKPSARMKTAQELLGRFMDDPSYPIDLVASHHFRKNRYIGSKDRRAIRGTLYDMIRHFLALQWHVKSAGAAVHARSILLAHLFSGGHFKEALFQEGGYGLDPLTDSDRKLLKAFAGQSEKCPDWARLNCPEWLFNKFQARFPEGWEAELAAIQDRAPLTVRVNTLKNTMEEALEAAMPLGLQPCTYSQLGLSMPEHISLVPVPIYRTGGIEIQDEGSQMAMLLCDAKPGMQVMDLCAGAGGKTLGLAAAMGNKGQIHACDINTKRLKELGKRVQKAGVRNVQFSQIPESQRENVLQPFKGSMDRVVLDVPCSGSGTWRRSPDQRFALTDERLAGYIAAQKALLKEGASMVKSGGRLVYITCSLFQEEAEDQIEGFLEDTSGWRLHAYQNILKEQKISNIPETASENRACLLLTPAVHKTDGFFVAVLEKS